MLIFFFSFLHRLSALTWRDYSLVLKNGLVMSMLLSLQKLMNIKSYGHLGVLQQIMFLGLCSCSFHNSQWSNEKVTLFPSFCMSVLKLHSVSS